MRILLWHVHGSWTTAFVQGPHEYVVPVTPDRDADGLGRALTWDWPPSVVEKAPWELADLELDAVVLQRPREVDLVRAWTGRVAGRDLPAVYLEHNTPDGDATMSVHPMAYQRDIPVVHVTHFNRLFWDCGVAPTYVIEHGVPDPGHRYTGDLARAAIAVNDPVRRVRHVGTDLLGALSHGAPLDIFGMRVDRLQTAGMLPPNADVFEDLPQRRLHQEMAKRRIYLHTTRWTSLGLSLIEAMMLGMPVVGVSSTEVHRAVPRDAGVLSDDLDELVLALRALINEPELAEEMGRRARAAACERYDLNRFLADWETVLADLPAREAVLS